MMNYKKIKKALILTGDGINCEIETAHACKQAGFQPVIMHLNDVIAQKINLETLSNQYSLLVIPGGFSFGDELGSGKVLAIKIKHALGWDLKTYALRGGLVVGICNGFQALVKLGIFGEATLAQNSDGRFKNEWQTLNTNTKSTSPFLKGIAPTFDLPIRHGEGRMIFKNDVIPHDVEIALTYKTNPNGSFQNIAGLTTAQGRILGLMPHPEAFVRPTQHPSLNQPGIGLEFFKNAYGDPL